MIVSLLVLQTEVLEAGKTWMRYQVTLNEKSCLMPQADKLIVVAESLQLHQRSLCSQTARKESEGNNEKFKSHSRVSRVLSVVSKVG